MSALRRVDRVVALILLAGAASLGVVLWVLSETLTSERDHTRSVLVAQRVGRDIATTTGELRNAAAAGLGAASPPKEVFERIADAEDVLLAAAGRPRPGGDSLGRIEDGTVARQMGGLAEAIHRWRTLIGPALTPSATTAQRLAAARRGDALRATNAQIVAIIRDHVASDKRRANLLRAGLAAMFAVIFGLLAHQVARNRRTLRRDNEELRERVDEHTALLSAKEAQLRAIVDSSLDAVIVADAERVVREWNPRATELFGIPAEAALGQPVRRERVPANVWRHLQKGFRRYAETGDPRVFDGRVEDVVRNAAGETIPIEVSVSGAQLGPGRLKITHVVRDITERMRAQAAIEAARDAAERAGLAKSSFLATMSHEIRTPMNAIVGMTSLLLDSPLTPEQRHQTETIRLSGDQLLAIISDILDFSKIESGKLELERHPFALREVIESSLDLVAPQANAKELDLGYLLETDGSTTLVGDSTRLRQVLINFLSNAVKFTRDGAVTIHGRLQAAGEDRARLRLEVRDTGIGIPPEGLERLFRSFSQVDASTTRKYGGTGLGLAISRRLVEAMGGEVSVRSEEGRGSTFAIDVELERVPGPDPVTNEVPDIVRGCRVLAVDDNAVNRELIERQLATWGMEVTSFERPVDAIRLVEAGEWFDVALLDMAMPGMDGLALADRLAEATGYTLPIVLLSSIGGVDPEIARGRLAATLSKPVKPATLLTALAGALGGVPERPRPMREHPEAPPHLSLHPLRVLVAEDNLVNQQVATATLERLGHRVDIAGDGAEALDAVKRYDYDLVLMDVQMPRLDGLEATRRIRAELPAERQPRIVAMTANAFTEDREACEAAGMDDFLSKPVTREDMTRVLTTTRHVVEPTGSAPRGPTLVQTAGGEPPRLVDVARLADATAGDASLAQMLIELHEEEGTALLSQLRAAVAEGDIESLRAAAHTLKSASASIGAIGLAQLSEDLEHAARSGHVVDPEGRVDEIVEAFGHTQVEFQRVRTQL